MEGFQDVFWSGDFILWKNLIRHYALCLSQSVAVTQIMSSEFTADSLSRILQWSASNLPTPILKEEHQLVCARIFAEKGVEDCIKLLANVRPEVHREELAFYLSSLHAIILYHITERLRERGLIKRLAGAPFPQNLVSTTTKNITALLLAIQKHETSAKDVVSVMFDTGGRAAQQMALLALFDRQDEFDPGWRFLAFEFTDFYCKNIPATLYPDWYAACFVGNARHAAMWAHYGDRHEGVCLKFRAQIGADNRALMTLTGPNGWSGNADGIKMSIGQRPFHLEKVKYTKSFPQIDFFRSLGRLPIPVLNKDWYSDNGELSNVARHVFSDESNWRKTYWDNLQAVTTSKFDDWQHEDEYRMVLNGVLEKEIDEENRTYKYDFADLDGIIFGMNASMDNKLKIMKVIEQKCANAGCKEFEFLQAVYSSGTNKFDVVRLHLLKIA